MLNSTVQPITDADIEALAEKEYPKPEYNGALPNWYLTIHERDKENFIKGYKTAIRDKLKPVEQEQDKR